MAIPRRFLSILAVLGLAVPALAQDTAKTPYWASIRSSEVNMRVGPGEDYRILWVYKRPLLPLKVLRIKEGWRYVRDPAGAQGWVLHSLLTRQRTGYIQGKEPAAAGTGPYDLVKTATSRFNPAVSDTVTDRLVSIVANTMDRVSDFAKK